MLRVFFSAASASMLFASRLLLWVNFVAAVIVAQFELLVANAVVAKAEETEEGALLPMRWSASRFLSVLL